MINGLFFSLAGLFVLRLPHSFEVQLTAQFLVASVGSHLVHVYQGVVVGVAGKPWGGEGWAGSEWVLVEMQNYQ